VSRAKGGKLLLGIRAAFEIYGVLILSMLSRKTEDYLEAILNITEEKGYARVKNIANSLEIKPPSVVEMVKKLDKMGFVEHRKYEGVVLTPPAAV